jgi:hypothetical protein
MVPTVADPQEKSARGMNVGDEMIEIEIGWTTMTAVGAGELVVAVEVQRENAIGRGLANESRWIGIGSGKFIAGEPSSSKRLTKGWHYKCLRVGRYGKGIGV